jgi:hypothetical protein
MEKREGFRYPVEVGVGPQDARQRLRDVLDEIDYKPPRGQEGTITDLSSNQRLDLIVRMQTMLSQGYGQYEQHQDPDVLMVWPCVELRRVGQRMKPRESSDGVPDEYWQEKWEEVGGELYDGRMVCRADDPIREEVSDFGLPYGPPGYNSGYDWVPVRRDVAVDLGVIEDDEETEPQSRHFDDDVEESVEGMADDLVGVLLRALGKGYKVTKDGMLTTKKAAANEAAMANAFYGHAGIPGHQGGSLPQGVEAQAETKRARALASYKPSTKAKRRVSEQSEADVAKAIRGKQLGDNEPADVTKGKHAVEVKTIVDGNNDKITMHPESLARKMKQKATWHTVVVDARGTGKSYYYKKGLGSFRIANMDKVSLKDLAKLIK